MGSKSIVASRPSAPAGRHVSPWIVVILVGFFARIVLAYSSVGSDDAAMFWVFANLIRYRGLNGAYLEHPDFNHPPLSGMLARGVLWLTEVISGRVTPTDLADSANADVIMSQMSLFTFLFKLPCIAVEGLVCWLLYRIWTKRTDGNAAWIMAAGWAWALGPIVISSYHGNTDSIYAGLSLGAVWLLMGDRRRPLLAGLALAAAINIKLVPVLLIPVFLLHLRSRQELVRFLAGLSVGALPYLPLLYWDWFIAEKSIFTSNVLKYTPAPNSWGFAIPLTVGRPHPPKPGTDDLLLAFKAYGRFLILALVAAWTILWRFRGHRHDLYLGAATIYAIFLVFAPGFGVQYLAIVAPLLFAIGPRWLALAYGLASGLCAGGAYICYLEPGFPLFSKFREYFPPIVVVFGVITWGLLATFLVRSVRQAWKKPQPSPAPVASL